MVAKKNSLRICLVSSEVAPLAKTGGLADVSAALAIYLHRAGHDVRLLMPFYDTISRESLDVSAVDFLQDIPISIGGRDGSFSIDTCKLPGHDVPVYLLRCSGAVRAGDYLHVTSRRASPFHIALPRSDRNVPAHGVLRRTSCTATTGTPDWCRCTWKTIYAWDQLFAKTASVFTIHNIGYQGVVSADHLADLDLKDCEWALHQEDLAAGHINFLKTALLHADHLTTVSPTYAREIMQSEYGMGMEDVLRSRAGSVTGILNGIDVEGMESGDGLVDSSELFRR